jgi:hypothetical protein
MFDITKTAILPLTRTRVQWETIRENARVSETKDVNVWLCDNGHVYRRINTQTIVTNSNRMSIAKMKVILCLDIYKVS